ncbi:MAG: PEPxxWA-CTERM sorting domain-containing protein [Parasphingorhabdus sp.]|uniref:PEPxxWA-CTERM sorting domain-containing protein n=1 Tax=Parasphingorhabdus sp. TaxID=2709688 RepID=UPI0032980465
MKKLLLATAATLLISGTANAALVDMEVPDNAYITVGGLDWAWAAPLPGIVDLGFQSQFGWRLPTAEELANAPTAGQFLFDGANVPLGGSDPVSGATFQFTDSALNMAGAVASPYFNNSFFHVDFCEGLGSGCDRFSGAPWAGQPGSSNTAESLVVRFASAGAVPEPATWAFMIFGFGAIGGALRRNRKANVKVSYA